MLGSTELIVIVLIIFILFGAKSLPKFAKSLGEARKELQKGFEEANKGDSKNNSTKRLVIYLRLRFLFDIFKRISKTHYLIIIIFIKSYK